MNRLSLTGVAVFALLAGTICATPAFSQASNLNQPGFHPPYKSRNQSTYSDGTEGTGAPPPALPGTLNTFAPAEKTQLDLPPTEALFDAIDRGDIASARDALSRGADINGHNLLGLTPVDLSIDLSRNDITFLLLSQRSGEAQPPVPQAASRTPAPPKTPAKPASAAAGVVAAAKPREAVAANRPAIATAAPVPPDPAAGFLGFGGTAQ